MLKKLKVNVMRSAYYCPFVCPFSLIKDRNNSHRKIKFNAQFPHGMHRFKSSGQMALALQCSYLKCAINWPMDFVIGGRPHIIHVFVP